MAHADTQQHPIGIYLWIWFLLFVLSLLSYLVDYMQFQGFLRWFLVCLFMMLKAGLIVAVFMHMKWERLAVRYAIIVPTGVLLFLMALMALEANYTLVTRMTYFMTSSGG